MPLAERRPGRPIRPLVRGFLMPSLRHPAPPRGGGLSVVEDAEPGAAAKRIGLIVFVAAAVLLGGASRPTMFLPLLQLGAAALLALHCLRPTPLPRVARAGVTLVVLAALLPFAWAVPLTAAVWSATPVGGWIADSYRAAGLPLGARGLGAVAGTALPAMLFMLLPLAAFVAAAGATRRLRWQLTVALALLAGAELLVGFSQFLSGNAGALRLYAITSHSGALGFFANRNHLAALLIATLPVVLMSAGRAEATGGRPAAIVWSAGVVLFMLGLAATLSRAGALLGVAILAATLAAMYVVRGREGERASGWFLYAAVGALLLAALVAGPAIAQRLMQAEDRRTVFMRDTAAAIGWSWPVGTGPGSFTVVYPAFERIEDMRPTFANHAHNDYLELLLEYGIAGGVSLVAGLLLWLFAAAQAWRVATREPLCLGAALGSAALLLHSAVDYPLRTPALAVLFGLLCGLMIPPAARWRVALKRVP